MSAAIKLMLAERAALAAAPKEQPYDPYTHLFEMIARAAPFMDEGCPMDKWPPSALLKIGYCVFTTGETGPKKAAQWVLSMLDRARELWLDGYIPDPFAKEPKLREEVAR